MKPTVKTEGFREMDDALAEFSKATAKNILKRVGLEAIQPIADDMEMRANAPGFRHTGQLAEAIGTGTKLAPRQRRLNRDPSTVEVYAGVTHEDGKGMPPQATQQEFGNENHGPQPFARPAFDTKVQEVLDGVKEGLGTEIEKARVRAARKALKAKG